MRVARGIVPQPKAVGKRIEKEGQSDAARDARKKTPREAGAFQICKLQRANWPSYGLVGVVVGAAGLAAGGFCCAGAPPFTG